MKVTTIALLLVTVCAAVGQAQSPAMPEMIRVEGGSFIMGDTSTTEDSATLPLHKVTVKSFRIARTETTVAQWQVFCNATSRLMPDPPKWGWSDNHPIVNVSWEDAVAYCKWLSDSTKKRYRLPTEAEWEYAARGGKNSKDFVYSGGQAMYMLGWYDENSNSSTHPVAQKRPNELGLYDMSGNVWEWCQDWFGPYTASDKADPQGAAHTPDTHQFKVLRGGSWNFVLEGCRNGRRNFFDAVSRQSDYGFRVVMDWDSTNKEAAPATEKKEEKSSTPKRKGK